eukprot:gene25569-34128_t
MNDNDNTELELTRTDPKITLSLQGHLFILPADHVLCHEWLVKTIAETDVGKDAIRDVVYLDCEPDSFLLIYKILNNLYDIQNLSRLSEIALELLVSSCKYMNCEHIATIIEELIEKKHSEAKAAKKEKASFIQQLEEQQQLLEERDMSFLNEKWMPVYNCICPNFRERRTGNKCNNPAIIIGDISIDNIMCADCEVPMKVKRTKYRTDVVRKLRDVSSHYEKYCGEST